MLEIDERNDIVEFVAVMLDSANTFRVENEGNKAKVRKDIGFSFLV